MKLMLQESKKKYKELADLIQKHKILENYLLKLDQSQSMRNKIKRKKKIFKQRKG